MAMTVQGLIEWLSRVPSEKRHLVVLIPNRDCPEHDLKPLERLDFQTVWLEDDSNVGYIDEGEIECLVLE